MKYRLLKLALIIFVCHPNLLFSQTEVLVDKALNNLSGHSPEIIYLQTSKGIYETGEDLWFKAYQLNAQSLELTQNSNTLFLQMVSQSDSMVWQEKYPFENGLVSGHVYIDVNVPEGDYFIEAYTVNTFFKDSTELNSVRKVSIRKNIASNTPTTADSLQKDLRFETFPEGGSMVYGTTSRLAFKATDGKGSPVDISGTLYEDNQPVTEINSLHAGMGSVLFTPMQGKAYSIRLSNGKDYPIDKILTEGISLHLKDHGKEYLEFMVSQNSSMPVREIYLFGQTRGIVCCAAQVILKDSLKIKIPLSEFPVQGIAEFTIFDSNMLPVSERLVYIHPERKLYITAKPDKNAYKPREKATIKIKVTDCDGKPVSANLAMSVFDKTYTDPTDPVNIMTYCHLSSQIRGAIYDPAYYFNEKNKNRAEAMDLLMLTQGWRRYLWNTLEHHKTGEAILSEDINGIQTIRSKKASETQQMVQVFGPEGNSTSVWADSIGHFTIGTDIHKTLRGGYIYIKPLVPKEFGPNIDLDDQFKTIGTIRSMKKRVYPYTDPNSTKEDIYRTDVDLGSSIMVDAVTVTAKTGRQFRDKFMGRLDSMSSIELGPWVCEHGHLENYWDGYTVHHDPRYCPEPNPVKEKSKPIEGKMYRLMKPEYYYGDNGKLYFKPVDEQNIIYHGPSEEEILRKNNLWRVKGYYGAREFYQPDEFEIQSSLPDARNTLLWNPSVVTDEKGEATVTFYCSDINTGFTGKIEGVGDNGLIGASDCEFRIIKLSDSK